MKHWRMWYFVGIFAIYLITLITYILLGIVSGQEVKPHHHDDKLPGPEDVWRSCCHDHDCREALINVTFLDEKWAKVTIASFKPIKVERNRVFPSENGKSYFCTVGAALPPTDDNILCVFYNKPSFVYGTRKDSTI